MSMMELKLYNFPGYRSNFFNYINMTTPDVSGLFRFVTDELQDAEDVGDRGLLKMICLLLFSDSKLPSTVWIMGHAPPGW
jgi:hypothetical protein